MRAKFSLLGTCSLLQWDKPWAYGRVIVFIPLQSLSCPHNLPIQGGAGASVPSTPEVIKVGPHQINLFTFPPLFLASFFSSLPPFCLTLSPFSPSPVYNLWKSPALPGRSPLHRACKILTERVPGVVYFWSVNEVKTKWCHVSDTRRPGCPQGCGGWQIRVPRPWAEEFTPPALNFTPLLQGLHTGAVNNFLWMDIVSLFI